MEQLEQQLPLRGGHLQRRGRRQNKQRPGLAAARGATVMLRQGWYASARGFMRIASPSRLAARLVVAVAVAVVAVFVVSVAVVVVVSRSK